MLAEIKELRDEVRRLIDRADPAPYSRERHGERRRGERRRPKRNGTNGQ